MVRSAPSHEVIPLSLTTAPRRIAAARGKQRPLVCLSPAATHLILPGHSLNNSIRLRNRPKKFFDRGATNRSSPSIGGVRGPMNQLHADCSPSFTPSSDETTFPWQSCAASKLVERYCELVRVVSAELPRGEFRLRDDLKRSSARLRKHVGLAAGEPEGARFLLLIQDALRDLYDTSLWIWECLKNTFGPPDAAREAWDILRRVSSWLHSLPAPKLEPHVPPARPSAVVRSERARPTLASAVFDDRDSIESVGAGRGRGSETSGHRAKGGGAVAGAEAVAHDGHRSSRRFSDRQHDAADFETPAESLRSPRHSRSDASAAMSPSFPATTPSPHAGSARPRDVERGLGPALRASHCGRHTAISREGSSQWLNERDDDEPAARAAHSSTVS